MFDDRSHTYTWPSGLDTESVVEPEVDGIPRTTCHLVLGDSSGIEPTRNKYRSCVGIPVGRFK